MTGPGSGGRSVGVRSFPVPWAKVKTRPAPRVRLPVGFAPLTGLLKTASEMVNGECGATAAPRHCEEAQPKRQSSSILSLFPAASTHCHRDDAKSQTSGLPRRLRLRAMTEGGWKRLAESLIKNATRHAILARRRELDGGAALRNCSICTRSCEAVFLSC